MHEPRSPYQVRLSSHDVALFVMAVVVGVAGCLDFDQALAGCEDGGRCSAAAPDTGTALPDATSVSLDAGETPRDAALPADAGSVPSDAGGAPSDAGLLSDAGNVPSDGGTIQFNEPAGLSTQIDTGPMTQPPAQTSAGTWNEGNVTFTMWSAAVDGGTDSVANLGLVLGGSGLRLTYPPTLIGGNSPVRFGTGIPNHGTGTLYVRYRIRYSPNWTQNGNVGTKMCEPRTLGNENHVLGTVDDNYGAENYPGLLLQGPNGRAADLPAAVAPSWTFGAQYADPSKANLCCGTWHWLEYLMVMESPAGTSNGSVTIWIDGAQQFTASGFSYIASGETTGWGYFMFDPTYGGGTHHPPDVTPNIYWDIDQLFVATK
jgi:hypothetical protein